MEVLTVCDCTSPVWIAIRKHIICYYKNEPVILQDSHGVVFVDESKVKYVNKYDDSIILADIVDIYEKIYSKQYQVGNLIEMVDQIGLDGDFNTEQLFVNMSQIRNQTPIKGWRTELEEFLRSMELPDSDMSIYTLNQIRFALLHAPDEEIQRFFNWLYYDYEDNLNNLINGKYEYRQNFGELDVTRYHYKIPNLTTDPISDYLFLESDENINKLKSRAEKIINKKLPYGLSYDNVYTKVDLQHANVYVYTSFNGQNETNPEELIAVVDFT